MLLAKIKSIFLITIILVCSAFLYLLRFNHSPQVGSLSDDGHYLVMAESFASGHLNHLVNYPDAPVERMFPPGYSLLILAPVFKVVGYNFLVLKATSLILSLVNILLLFVFLRNKLKEPFLSIVVALFAFNPMIAGFSSVLLSEASFIFFVLLFMIFFEKGIDHPKALNVYSGLAWITLGGAFWIRYWGITLLASALIFLLFKRKWLDAVLLMAGFGICVVPLYFVFMPGASGSYWAFQALNTRVLTFSNLVENLRLSIGDYFQAVPYVLFPAIGPSTVAALAGKNLGWVVNVLYVGILAVFGLGMWLQRARNTFLVVSIVFYFPLLFALTSHGTSQSTTHDAPRYSAAFLPFLYLFFFEGSRGVIEWLSKRHAGLRNILLIGLTVSILLVSLFRNYRDIRSSYPLPDLSAGSAWVKGNTAVDAVIMTSSPIQQYLYLQRKTVDYPTPEGLDAFLQNASSLNVGYILITPPLLIDQSNANSRKEYTAFMRDRLLPALQRFPQKFLLVYEYPATNTLIYQVQK